MTPELRSAINTVHAAIHAAREDARAAVPKRPFISGPPPAGDDAVLNYQETKSRATELSEAVRAWDWILDLMGWRVD